MKPLFLSLLALVLLIGCAGSLTKQIAPPQGREEIDTPRVATKATMPTVVVPESSPDYNTSVLVSQFELYDDDPIITTDLVGKSVADMYLGDVVLNNGMFHMLFGVYVDHEPGNIYHAISDNGYHWEMASDQPVSVPQGGIGVAGISVLMQDDNSWIMYRGTADGGVGQMVAPQLDGPWTLSETTLVASDGPGTWDEHGLAWIDLVAYGSGYAMYFVGSDKWTNSIGAATFADSHNWRKYDDPTTTNSRFVHSDPVIRDPSDMGKQVADYFLRAPAVQITSADWQMIYIASPTPVKGGKDTFNLATSADGIIWEPYSGNPIFEPPLDYNDILDATWITSGGTEFLYFTLRDDQGLNIYLATAIN